MGKKKSVVLTVLITIVILAICVVSAFPSFDIKNSIKRYMSAAAQYDLDWDLGGGYYTTYYPSGVISALEYNSNVEEKADDEDALQEYTDSYTVHGEFGGIYLSTDEDDGIVRLNNSTGEYEITEEFKDNFAATVDKIKESYAARGYSAYRVSVVDDYSIRVEVPSSDTAAGTTLSYLSYTGAFTLSDGTTTYTMTDDDDTPSDYFRSFSLSYQRGNPYIKIKLTKAGVSKVADITSSIASSSSSSNSSSSGGTMYFKVGENNVISLSVSESIKAENKSLYISANDAESARVMCVALNSALHNGDTGITFNAIATTDIGSFDAVYGSNARNLLFIAVLVALLLAIVVPIVLYRGYGVAMAYSSVFYFAVAAFCFAFITEGILEVSAATAVIFLLGLVANIFMAGHTYDAIKKEVSLGKTVQSSVKLGYKKTFFFSLDVCVVLMLGGIALLIGAGGLHALSIQAMVCFALMSFCSLLFTRVMNFLLLSCANDKYKYFRFVREDEEDE